MAKRKLTPAEQLQHHVDECVKRYAHWEAERRDGCVDPNWADGTNLNLVRGHIICAKKKIRHTCEEFGLVIPAIYFRALPPVMPDDFFVTDGKNYNPQRAKRIKSLRGVPESEQTDKREVVAVQLSLF